MAKKKMKSVAEQILSNMKTARTTDVELHGEYLEGVSVNVRHTLPFEDVLSFARELADSCMDTDLAEYYPEAYEPVKNTLILVYYAGIEMPEDASLCYRIVTETQVVDQILPHINARQLDDICQAAQNRLCFNRELITSVAGSRTAELLAKFNEVLDANQKIVDDMGRVDFSGAMEKISGMVMDKHKPDEGGRMIGFARPARDKEE